MGPAVDEATAVAGAQPLSILRLAKHPRQQGADHAVDEVHRGGVQRVVDAQPQQAGGGADVGGAGKEAQHHRRPLVDETGVAGHNHQSWRRGKGVRAAVRRVWVAVAGQRGARARIVRIDGCMARLAHEQSFTKIVVSNTAGSIRNRGATSDGCAPVEVGECYSPQLLDTGNAPDSSPLQQ